MHKLLPRLQSVDQDRVEITQRSAVRSDDVGGEDRGSASRAADLRARRGELDLNAAARRATTRQTKLPCEASQLWSATRAATISGRPVLLAIREVDEYLYRWARSPSLKEVER